MLCYGDKVWKRFIGVYHMNITKPRCWPYGSRANTINATTINISFELILSDIGKFGKDFGGPGGIGFKSHVFSNIFINHTFNHCFTIFNQNCRNFKPE